MKRTMLFAAFAATAALTPTAPALAQSVTDGTLAEARAATARFHNVEVALDAGYAPGSPCEPGQGIHYVNMNLAFDPTLDVTTPEVLLYEPQKNGKLIEASFFSSRCVVTSMRTLVPVIHPR